MRRRAPSSPCCRAITGGVNSAAFSPDGSRVVTASRDETARLWDAETGASLTGLEGHTDYRQQRRVQPGRVAGRDRLSRQHRAAVGCGNWRLARRAAGAHGLRQQRRVQPGRVAGGDRLPDNTARLWAVWPLLTGDTIAYAGVSALRALSREERASLYLTEADAAAGQKYAAADDPAAVCDRLAGNPFDPCKTGARGAFDAINAERAVPACRAAVRRRPTSHAFVINSREPFIAPINGMRRRRFFAPRRSRVIRLPRMILVSYQKSAAVSPRMRLRRCGCTVWLPKVAMLWPFRRSDASTGTAAGSGWIAPRRCAGSSGVPTGTTRSRTAGWPRLRDRRSPATGSGEGALPSCDRGAAVRGGGDEPDAGTARARRGSLARALAPETVVRIAREAAARRPKGP